MLAVEGLTIGALEGVKDNTSTNDTDEVAFYVFIGNGPEKTWIQVDKFRGHSRGWGSSTSSQETSFYFVR